MSHLLKALRILNGMKQQDLARKVDRSQPWVSLVERGKLLPGREQARQIAEALKVDQNQLFS